MVNNGVLVYTLNQYITLSRLRSFSRDRWHILNPLQKNYRHSYSSAPWNWAKVTFISIRMTRYHLHFFLSYNGRFLEVSSEQRKMKISSNRAFSIITYLQWKIVQESAKAPVFPASIQLIFSAFDKNSSASFHQTTSHDKHTTTIMAADVFLFNRSIHSPIHARLPANQSVYTPYTPLQIHGKRRRVVMICAAKTVVEYLNV